MGVLAGLVLTLSLPLDAQPQHVTVITGLLILWSVSGWILVTTVFPSDAPATALLLGPGLLLGSMLFALLEWIRVSIGVTTPLLSALAMFAIVVASRRRVTGLLQPCTRPRGALTALVGISLAALGYGRPPLMAAGILLTGIGLAGPAAFARRRDVAASLIVVATALVLIAHMMQSDRLPAAAIAESLHENLALGVTDLTGSDRLLDRDVRYHWLGHLVAGGAIRLGGLTPFLATGAVVPLVAVLGSAASAYCLAIDQRRWGHRGAVAMACLLIAGASPVEQLVFGSDQQSANRLSTSWLVAASYLAVLVSQRRGTRWVGLAVLGGAAAALAGAKFSHAIVLAVVLLGTCVASPRSPDRWSAALVAVAGTAVTYVLLIHGGASAAMVNRLPLREAVSLLIPSPRLAVAAPAWIAASTGMVLFVLLYVVRTPSLALLRARRASRAEVAAVTLAGMCASLPTFVFAWGEERNLYWLSGAVTCGSMLLIATAEPLAHMTARTTATMTRIAASAGAVTLAMLGLRVRYERRDSSRADLYWQFLTWAVTLWPIVLIATVAVVGACMRPRLRRDALSVAAALVCASSSMAVYVHAGGAGTVIRRATEAESQPDRGAPTERRSEALLAGLWLRDVASDNGELVATNIVCTRTSCDNEAYLIGATSQRPVLWEGAIASYKHFDPATLVRDSVRKERLSTTFGQRPSAATAAELRALGVRWYVLRISSQGPSPRETCAANSGWTCELQLDHTLVMDLEPDA